MPPLDRSNRLTAPPDAAPQRRKERGAPTVGSVSADRDRIEERPSPDNAGLAEPTRHREEVVGQGSGETAGGSPVSAAGEDTSTKWSDAEDSISFDPQSFSQGGVHSNTPPQKTTLGGEDYLTVNFYLRYESFHCLRRLLEKAQEEAKKGSERNTVQLGDVLGLVSPGGASLGKGKNALYAPWRIETDHGISLLVTNRSTPHETQPSVQARATSLPLMRLGFPASWSLMQYLMERLGGKVVANKLSRVDPCIDLPGVPVRVFCEPFEQGWYVSRAKKGRRDGAGERFTDFSTGKKPSGLTVGVSPLVIRVYDKRQESGRDPVKLEVLTTSRWGELVDLATRVELQIGRSKLKRFGVDTVEDWIMKRADIIDHLVTKTFRLTSGPVDRSHADRTPTHTQWLRVRGLFQECYGIPFGYDLQPLPSVAVDPTSLVAIAVGVLKTAHAVTGRRVNSNDAFLRSSLELLNGFIADRDMAAEVDRRALERKVEGLRLE